jgi:hypothetical protein
MCSGRMCRINALSFNGEEVFFDDPVEIVSKKLYRRCDRFYPRDFFDWAIV